MSKAKVMLVGAGSLVAREILAALDGRRDRLTIIGANRDLDAPNMRLCDYAVPLPPTSMPEDYRVAVLDVIAAHQPDLIIPCRDPEIPLVAQLASRRSGLRDRVVCGSSQLATELQDKLALSDWASANELPVARSVRSGRASTAAQSAALVADHGFPLIAKPVRGSGSIGIRVLLGPDHLQAVQGLADLVIQPFYDPPDQLVPDLGCGVPLFWEVPTDREVGIQLLIGHDGGLGPQFGFISSHRLGRNATMTCLRDDALDQLGLAYAAALTRCGWRGPANLQVRRGPSGWVPIELNPRFSGGTAGRTLLGFDEVGWTINSWLGEQVVPPLVGPPAAGVIWDPQARPR